MNSVGRWADKNQILYTEFSELSINEKVITLVKDEVIKINDVFPSNERIEKFIILNKQFNADQGELTRTLKIRRNFIEENYRVLIEAMYTGANEVSTSTLPIGTLKESSLQIVQLTNREEVMDVNDILLSNAH
jgi:long-chain acyl-CoA synthetase